MAANRTTTTALRSCTTTPECVDIGATCISSLCVCKEGHSGRDCKVPWIDIWGTDTYTLAWSVAGVLYLIVIFLAAHSLMKLPKARRKALPGFVIAASLGQSIIRAFLCFVDFKYSGRGILSEPVINALDAIPLILICVQVGTITALWAELASARIGAGARTFPRKFRARLVTYLVVSSTVFMLSYVGTEITEGELHEFLFLIFFATSVLDLIALAFMTLYFGTRVLKQLRAMGTASSNGENRKVRKMSRFVLGLGAALLLELLLVAVFPFFIGDAWAYLVIMWLFTVVEWSVNLLILFTMRSSPNANDGARRVAPASTTRGVTATAATSARYRAQ